jgi:hypothetical protein
VALFSGDTVRNQVHCWREICPGQTTGKQMQGLAQEYDLDNFQNYTDNECWEVKSRPNWSICASYSGNPDDRPISDLLLRPLEPIKSFEPMVTLGDLMMLFGQPVDISLACWETFDGSSYYDIDTTIDFDNNVQVETLTITQQSPDTLDTWWLDAHMAVRTVIFYGDYNPPNHPVQTWQGFSSLQFPHDLCGDEP